MPLPLTFHCLVLSQTGIGGSLPNLIQVSAQISALQQACLIYIKEHLPPLHYLYPLTLLHLSSKDLSLPAYLNVCVLINCISNRMQAP